MANLPNLSTSGLVNTGNINVTVDDKPFVEVTKTVQVLNKNLTNFTSEIRNAVKGLSLNLEKNNNYLKDKNKKISDNYFLNNILNDKKERQDRKKELSEIENNFKETLQKINSNLTSTVGSSSNPRSQSLFNLTLKQIAKDTVGTMYDRTLIKLTNNPIFKGFASLKDTLSGLRKSANAMFPSNLMGRNRRKELTQEEIELNREKIQREEKTNELLEDILEAILNGYLKPKNKVGDVLDSAKKESFWDWINPFTTAIGAMGLYATTQIPSFPALFTQFKKIVDFIRGFKNIELPELPTKAKITSWITNLTDFFNKKLIEIKDTETLNNLITKINQWIDDVTIRMKNLKLSDLGETTINGLQKINNFFETLKNDVLLKYPNINKILNSDFKTNFGNAIKFFTDLKNEILLKYKLPEIDLGFKTKFNEAVEFFSKLKTDILLKYKLPEIDSAYISSWEKMSAFFNKVPDIKIENIPGANLIDQLNDVFLKITKKLGDFINYADEIIFKIKTPDVRPPSTNVVPSPPTTVPDIGAGPTPINPALSTITSGTSTPMSGIKNLTSAKVDYATGNYSGITNESVGETKTNPQNNVKTPPKAVSPLNSFTSSIVEKYPSLKVLSDSDLIKNMMDTYKKSGIGGLAGKGAATLAKLPIRGGGALLPYIGWALGIADVGLNMLNPEAVTGKSLKDATFQDRLAAGAVTALYDFTPIGLPDLVMGEDTRRKWFEIVTKNPYRGSMNPMDGIKSIQWLIDNYNAYTKAYNRDVGYIWEMFDDSPEDVAQLAKKIIKKEESFEGTSYLDKDYTTDPQGKIQYWNQGDFGKKWDAYPIGAEKYAIGYGFNTLNNEPVIENQTITEEEAERHLLEKIKSIQSLLSSATKNNAGEIYENIDNPVRKAILISTAYQMGVGSNKENDAKGLLAFNKTWKELSKANEDEGNTPLNWESVGNNLKDNKFHNSLKARKGDDSDLRYDRMKDMMTNGQLLKFYEDVEGAKDGAISFGPRLLLTGEYPNAKNNPELTAPINFIKDEMVDVTDKILSKVNNEYQRNDLLRELSIEQRVVSMFQKTGEMEQRLKQKESLETTRSKLNMPIVNNVVDNKQITNNNQSVLMRRAAENAHNVFRLN